ncbi:MULTISPECIES: hypothetical protein [Pseudomonas]|uniref:hypothetical protein n=1 Tax=Pseudomonas TaxID=286 RepID=UPI0015E27C51|nr:MULTISPECIES: hypothetical protein [Pseudomonas]MBA1242289.1 hypothetical protein [Pseudomonas japonica]MBA1288606.1 hypothetical protein [Pseudomonas japonica]
MRTKIIYFHNEYRIETNPEYRQATLLERVYDRYSDAYIPEPGKGISIQQGSRVSGFSVESVQVRLEADFDVFLVHLRDH